MKEQCVRRYSLFCLVIGVLIFSSSAFAYEKSGDHITLKVAHVSPPGSPTDKAVKKFNELLMKETGGTVSLKIFPSEQLGAEKAALEGVVLGTIDCSLNDAGYIASLYPPIGVLDFPYTYTGWEHYRKLIDSAVFRNLADAAEEETGIKIITPYLFGRRMLCSNNKILSPEDARKTKIRTPTSELAMESARVLGGIPTAVAYSEAYMALKLGVADAAENPFTGIYDMKWYEVTKYLVLTEHVWTNEILTISQRAWKALSPAQQKAFRKTAIESAMYRIELQQELESVRQKELEEFGMTLVKPASLAPFQKISDELAQKYRKKYAQYNWGQWQDKVKNLDK